MGSTERPIRAVQTSVGPVGIFWDMENCRIPSDVNPDDVAVNIRMALRLHPLIGGAVISFTAYGDFNGFPRRLREACQRTGVKLIDVPNTRKDAADKAILVDLFLFALDHPLPSTILLISGDVDFANALHVLGQRGYTVILAAPVNAAVCPALRNASHFLWDWPAVARGGATGATAVDSSALSAKDEIQSVQSMDLEGFKKQVVRLLNVAGGSLPLVKLFPEYSKMYGTDGIKKRCKLLKLLDKMGDVLSLIGEGESRTVVLRREEEGGSSSSSGTTVDSSAAAAENKIPFVIPGNLEVLKKQVVKLLKCVGRSLPLVKLPTEYERMYRRQLSLVEYGAEKLVNLLNMIGDVVTILGEGQTRMVVLQQEEEEGSSPSVSASVDSSTTAAEVKIRLVQPRDLEGLKKQVVKLLEGAGGSLPLVKLKPEYAKMYGGQLCLAECGTKKLSKQLDQIGDVVTVVGEGTSKVVVLRQAGEGETSVLLENFRQEVEELLVCYCGRILCSDFEGIYEQRYKRGLDCRRFRVTGLEELVEKVSDLVVLEEERGTGRKSLVFKSDSG